jgi:hypothetical protein
MKFLHTLLLTLAIFFSGIVNAALIEFSINDTVTQGAGLSDVYGCNAGSIGGVIDGFDLMLDPGCAEEVLDFQLKSGQFVILLGSFNFLDALSAGSVISDSSAFSATNSWAYALFGEATTDFTASFTDMFLGFKTGNGKYGYIEAEWTISNNVGTLSLGTGAYESIAGVAITIPSKDVPEPTTLALFALAMIGLASRRFKQQHLIV